MAYIKTIDPKHADGDLAAMYERIAGARGAVAHILQIQSLNPQALGAHFEMYRVMMFGPSGLSRARRETLAVAVSAANACHY